MKYAIYCGYPIIITNWDIKYKWKEEIKRKLIFGNYKSFIYEVPKDMSKNMVIKWNLAYWINDEKQFEEISREQYFNLVTKIK